MSLVEDAEQAGIDAAEEVLAAGGVPPGELAGRVKFVPAVIDERWQRAIDLLERQVCNCMGGKGKKVRVQCLRCELLELLR